MTKYWSVLLWSDVVLEYQSGRCGDNQCDAQRHEPRNKERKADGRDCCSACKDDRPETTRAEEAQVAGAVADLRVVEVLWTCVQASSDESEVRTDDEGQAERQSNCGDTCPLDAGAGEPGEDRVHNPDEKEDPMGAGGNTGRLSFNDRDFDKRTGIPLMSAIPIRVRAKQAALEAAE